MLKRIIFIIVALAIGCVIYLIGNTFFKGWTGGYFTGLAVWLYLDIAKLVEKEIL